MSGQNTEDKDKIIIIRRGKAPKILEFDEGDTIQVTACSPDAAQQIKGAISASSEPGAIKKSAHAVASTVTTGVKAASTGVVVVKEKTKGFFGRLGDTIRGAANQHDERAREKELMKEKIAACKLEVQEELKHEREKKPC